MDHQQLAARMVCSWGLVKAYQQRLSKMFMFAHWHPHIMEAYNHKVNHDTHKELSLQEHAVLEYAHALQYISFCNDARYKDHWAPAVKDFWGRLLSLLEVGSLQLRPLSPLG